MIKWISQFVDKSLDSFKGWLLNLDAVTLTEIESIFMNAGLALTFASTFLSSPGGQSAFYRTVDAVTPIPICVVTFAILAVIQWAARHSYNPTLRWLSCLLNGMTWTGYCVMFLGISIALWQSGFGAVVVIGHFVFGINAITSVLCGCHIVAAVSEKKKRLIKMKRLSEWMKKEGVG